MELYQSTEKYTVEKFVDMGVNLNRVINSQGMIVAVLNDEQFEEQYTPLPVVPEQ